MMAVRAVLNEKIERSARSGEDVYVIRGSLRREDAQHGTPETVPSHFFCVIVGGEGEPHLNIWFYPNSIETNDLDQWDGADNDERERRLREVGLEMLLPLLAQ